MIAMVLNHEKDNRIVAIRDASGTVSVVFTTGETFMQAYARLANRERVRANPACGSTGCSASGRNAQGASGRQVPRA
jgi:hypothetical protein